ncbi:hypothetical protein [uncultured Pseudodesulfovibrio sp.]|uniref:hypothetical protein n=1 Tax=uncultured Pseudodesulfovibrio sp. TaxID=2035858 RepID=UPI0029C72DFF|nr:hypothetical protein [uncultured Pseudodesulfovibrio sp.]
MIKFSPLILALTFALMTGSLAHAMDDGDMRPEYVAMRQDVLAMDANMRQMELDVEDLKVQTRCRDALKSMDRNMSEMRMRMHKVGDYADLSGNMSMKSSLNRLNRALTDTLQGVGQCLRDQGKAIPMIQDGVKRMRTALDEIRAGI